MQQIEQYQLQKKEKPNSEVDYFNVKAISNSSLGWYLKSPRYYQLKINQEIKEDDQSYFDLGSAIHCYILENNIFNDKYIISYAKPIEGLMGKFISHYAKYDNLEEAYQYSEFKYPLDRVLESFKEDKNQNYYNFIKQSQNKTIISKDDFKTIENIYNGVVVHKKASKLLISTSSLPELGFLDESEVFTEHEIYFQYMNSFCKAKLDRFIVNHTKKEIILVDLKTTSKSVYDFSKAFLSYAYDRQLAFYNLALLSIYPDYKITSYIVACQTSFLNEVICYKISEEQISNGLNKVNDIISKIEKHNLFYFDYPLEYFEGDGSVELIIDSNG